MSIIPPIPSRCAGTQECQHLPQQASVRLCHPCDRSAGRNPSLFSAWRDEKHATGCISGHSPPLSSGRELGQKQNWDASSKAQRLNPSRLPPRVPCSHHAELARTRLVYKRRDSWNGARGECWSRFHNAAAPTELVTGSASFAHQGQVSFSKILMTKFHYMSLYKNQKIAAMI